MCMNCGCGMPNADHGNPKNITTKTLQEAGDSNSQNLEETKRNMIESLQKTSTTVSHTTM